MDRAERIGLGVALAGHAALFAALSLTLLAPKVPMPRQPTMDVSLVPDVALEAAAPAATEAPAASRAPEVGPVEESPPPAPAESRPDPAPPAPQPKPAPQPAPPKPQPQLKPQPVPPPRPAPVAKPQPRPSAAPAPAPTRAKAPAKPTTATAPAARPATRPGSGTSAAAPAARPRGGSLGDIMKGIVAEAPPQARGEVPRAEARLDASALAGIQDAIRRQIQPCADRQVDPGPGANAIATTLNLRFNADGTLSATPTVVRQAGADGENARYKQRVVDLGIAALRACAPLRLPPEYYRTAAGGWSNINFLWKLR